MAKLAPEVPRDRTAAERRADWRAPLTETTDAPRAPGKGRQRNAKARTHKTRTLTGS